MTSGCSIRKQSPGGWHGRPPVGLETHPPGTSRLGGEALRRAEADKYKPCFVLCRKNETSIRENV